MFRSGLAEYNAMSTAFANFVKTGDPNGPGVPQWQEFGATGKVMYFAVDTRRWNPGARVGAPGLQLSTRVPPCATSQ
jgi:carboxylesterase type B